MLSADINDKNLINMDNYTDEAKQIYNKVCDKYEHHWLDTTVSQTMAMEMIAEALSIANVVGRSEQLFCPYCGNKKELKVETDLNSGRVCKSRLCKGK